MIKLFQLDIYETSHLYLFVKQLCFYLRNRAIFFVNSYVMFAKGRIMRRIMRIIQDGLFDGLITH